jgi:hypothetical protein
MPQHFPLMLPTAVSSLFHSLCDFNPDWFVVSDTMAAAAPLCNPPRDPSCAINGAKLGKNVRLKVCLVFLTVEDYFRSSGQSGMQVDRDGHGSWPEVLLIVTRWYLHIILSVLNAVAQARNTSWARPYLPVAFFLDPGNSHQVIGGTHCYDSGTRFFVEIFATLGTKVIVGKRCNRGSRGSCWFTTVTRDIIITFNNIAAC